MERLYSNLNTEGRNMHTSTKHRLPTRPTEMGGGGLFEDLGGTLKPPSQQKRSASGGSKPVSQASSQSKMTTVGYSKFKPSIRSRPPSPMPRSKGFSSQNEAWSRSNSVAPSRGTNNQSGTRPPSSSAINVSSDSDLDDDEMDLLSSQNGEDDPSTSQKPVSEQSKFKPSLPTRARQSIDSRMSKENPHRGSIEVYVDPNGRKHEYDRKFLPSKEKSLAGLKFSKTKNEEVPMPLPTFQSSADSFSPVISQEAFFKKNISSHSSNWLEIPIPDKEDDKSMDVASSPKRARKDEDKHVSPLGTKCVKSNRRDSPSSSHSRAPLPTRMPAISNSENVASQEPPVEPPKGRPKPRPVYKALTTVTDPQNLRFKKNSDDPRSSQLTGSSSLTKMLDNVSVDNTNRGRSRSRSCSLECSSPRKTRPDEFPALSPPGSPKRDPFANMSPLGSHEPSKPTSKVVKPKASSSRLPSAFPMAFTPTKAKDKEDEPMTKTRVRPSKEKAKDKGKGKAKESSDANDDDDDDYENYKSKNLNKEKEKKRKMAQPKAFPMSTQVLASIGSRDIPSSSPFNSQRHNKRSSEGGSSDERVSKKSRKARDLLQESPSRFAFDDEGDSLLMSNADPSTLCPYCDLPLPSNPSPLLLKLLAATKKKSQRDPRPYNPLGLKAPLTTFISVCQRHRFESQILPEAEKKGWPKTIEWKEVGSRVMKMQRELKALIEDPGDDVVLDGRDGGDDWEVGYMKGKRKEEKAKKGPKARSKFWVDVMDEVKKKGLRAVSGVRGQFANFEKTQPGYYGEQGSVIIHQTLYNMFPLDGINPALTAPLTANEFIERILVPEVALRLIIEDKDLDSEVEEDVEEALEILRESSSYGVAMFPEDGGEWGGGKKKGFGDDDEDEKLGVGDLIVMERARKRRKELEEEDEREMEELRLMEEEKQLQEAEREKSKKKLGAKLSVDLPEVATEPPVERPRPRPRPRPLKDSSAMSVADTPMDFEKEEKQIRSSKNRTRSMTRSRSRSVISNNGRRPGSEERRRSPSASESRRFENPPTSPRISRPDYMADHGFGWNRDASGTRAVANGDNSGGATLQRRSRSRANSRAGSRSRSTSVHPKRVERSSDSRMDVEQDNVGFNGDDSDEDDEVEVLGLVRDVQMKTPVQAQKQQPDVDVDDEPTPEVTAPAPPGNAASSMPPLLAAQWRAELKRQASSNSGGGTHAGRPPQLGMTRRPRKTSTWDRDREHPPHRAATDVDEPHAKNGVASASSSSWLLSDEDRSSQSQDKR